MATAFPTISSIALGSCMISSNIFGQKPFNFCIFWEIKKFKLNLKNYLNKLVEFTGVADLLGLGHIQRYFFHSNIELTRTKKLAFLCHKNLAFFYCIYIYMFSKIENQKIISHLYKRLPFYPKIKINALFLNSACSPSP